MQTKKFAGYQSQTRNSYTFNTALWNCTKWSFDKKLLFRSGLARTSHSCTIFTAVPGKIRGYQLFVHCRKSCPSEVIKDSLVKANTPCRSFLGLRNVQKYIIAWNIMVLLVFYTIFCYIFTLPFMGCLSNGVTKNSCHLFWYSIQLIRYCRSCMFSNSGHFYLVL